MKSSVLHVLLVGIDYFKLLDCLPADEFRSNFCRCLFTFHMGCELMSIFNLFFHVFPPFFSFIS